MTPNELTKILAAHKAWMQGEPHGVRANLLQANLRGANLTRADLYGARLTGADLREADLGAGVRYLHYGPVGSRGDELIVIYGLNRDEWHAGCFTGTEAELLVSVAKTHGDNAHGQDYRRVIAMLHQRIQAVMA